MPIQPDKPGADDPGRGRRLGIDVGTVRIGVAVSDSDGMLATPVETVPRVTGLKDRDGADIDRLIELITGYGVVEVVIGLPRDLHANGSASVRHAKEFAFRINRRLTGWDDQGRRIPVRLADERLTSVLATRAPHMSGRTTKNGRSVIDQAAAVEILRSWLDARANALSATDVEDGS